MLVAVDFIVLFSLGAVRNYVRFRTFEIQKTAKLIVFHNESAQTSDSHTNTHTCVMNEKPLLRVPGVDTFSISRA